MSENQPLDDSEPNYKKARIEPAIDGSVRKLSAAERLPNEVWLKIFNQLNFHDVVRVSKMWGKVAEKIQFTLTINRDNLPSHDPHLFPLIFELNPLEKIRKSICKVVFDGLDSDQFLPVLQCMALCENLQEVQIKQPNCNHIRVEHIEAIWGALSSLTLTNLTLRINIWEPYHAAGPLPILTNLKELKCAGFRSRAGEELLFLKPLVRSNRDTLEILTVGITDSDLLDVICECPKLAALSMTRRHDHSLPTHPNFQQKIQSLRDFKFFYIEEFHKVLKVEVSCPHVTHLKILNYPIVSAYPVANNHLQTINFIKIGGLKNLKNFPNLEMLILSHYRQDEYINSWNVLKIASHFPRLKVLKIHNWDLDELFISFLAAFERVPSLQTLVMVADWYLNPVEEADKKLLEMVEQLRKIGHGASYILRTGIWNELVIDRKVPTIE